MRFLIKFLVRKVCLVLVFLDSVNSDLSQREVAKEHPTAQEEGIWEVHRGWKFCGLKCTFLYTLPEGSNLNFCAN